MYIMKNEQKFGPISKDQFLGMVASGSIVKSTLISKDGENWRQAIAFSGIAWPEVDPTDVNLAFASEAIPSRAQSHPQYDSARVEVSNNKAIVRDVLVIYGLTFALGFLVSVSGAKGEAAILATASANILLLIVSFTVSGAIAKTDRFKHLVRVAIGISGLSMLNVVLFGMPIATWVLSAFLAFILMGIGGMLSYLFVSNPK